MKRQLICIMTIMVMILSLIPMTSYAETELDEMSDLDVYSTEYDALDVEDNYYPHIVFKNNFSLLKGNEYTKYINIDRTEDSVWLITVSGKTSDETVENNKISIMMSSVSRTTSDSFNIYEKQFSRSLVVENNKLGNNESKLFVHISKIPVDNCTFDVEVVQYSRLSAVGEISQSMEVDFGDSLKMDIENSDEAGTLAYPTFISSDSSIAYVDKDGTVHGKNIGSCMITATFEGGYQSVCAVIVGPGLNIKKTKLYVGEKENLELVGGTGEIWTTSDSSVATVSQKGIITAKGEGICSVIATCDGKPHACTVEVINPTISETNIDLHNSKKKTLKITGGTGKIKWSSSKKRIATVSSKGVVKGKKAGTCTITAKRNGVKMRCKVKVYSYYAECPAVPDFGAKYGFFRKKTEYDDGATYIKYRAKKSYIKKYAKALKRNGFYYVTGGKGAKLYMNDDFDIVATKYKKGYCYVMVGNAWE